MKTTFTFRPLAALLFALLICSLAVGVFFAEESLEAFFNTQAKDMTVAHLMMLLIYVQVMLRGD